MFPLELVISDLPFWNPYSVLADTPISKTIHALELEQFTCGNGELLDARLKTDF
jgi:hypothetical protein